MALRLFRYSFAAILIAVTVATFAHAGVLQLAPISEVGVAKELGVSRDAAAWVSEDGAGGECFADSGAVISDEGEAEVEEAGDVAEGAVVCVSAQADTISASTTPGDDQPGDVNGDGYVNQADVDVIASNWQYGVSGTPDATRNMGDLNDDGKVDGSDVTILAFYWGAEPIAVPEPSTIVLLSLGIVGLVVSRRLRRA